MRLFSLRGDLLIFHAPDYVKVWNFVTNMSATFDVGDQLFAKVILNDLHHDMLMS